MKGLANLSIIYRISRGYTLSPTKGWPRQGSTANEIAAKSSIYLQIKMIKCMQASIDVNKDMRHRYCSVLAMDSRLRWHYD